LFIAIAIAVALVLIPGEILITVADVADGQAALTALTDCQPDMIVLDVTMPVLNGLEVLRRIRETSTVPVLLLTAREDEIDKVLGLTAPTSSTGNSSTTPHPSRRRAWADNRGRALESSAAG